MKKNKSTFPQKNKKDAGHAIAKGVLSTIPIAGGPASELFNYLITPSLEKRRDEWLISLERKMLELEKSVNEITLERLSKNEKFISIVLQASQIALRNHQKEKLNSLQNAILNSAIPSSLEEDLQMIFLSFVDTFTPSHLKILLFLNDPKKWAEEHKISFPSWASASPSSVLEHAIGEFEGMREIYDPIIKNLYSQGLLNTEQLHSTMTLPGALSSRLTELGKSFVGFISSPISDKK